MGEMGVLLVRGIFECDREYRQLRVVLEYSIHTAKDNLSGCGESRGSCGRK